MKWVNIKASSRFLLCWFSGRLVLHIACSLQGSRFRLSSSTSRRSRGRTSPSTKCTLWEYCASHRVSWTSKQGYCFRELLCNPPLNSPFPAAQILIMMQTPPWPWVSLMETQIINAPNPSTVPCPMYEYDPLDCLSESDSQSLWISCKLFLLVYVFLTLLWSFRVVCGRFFHLRGRHN